MDTLELPILQTCKQENIWTLTGHHNREESVSRKDSLGETTDGSVHTATSACTSLQVSRSNSIAVTHSLCEIHPRPDSEA